MANSFCMHLSIHSIQSTLFDGEAEKLIARTTTGEITVLDTHEPLFTQLTGPHLRIIMSSGEEKIIELPSGFLEVQPDSRAVILVNPL